MKHVEISHKLLENIETTNLTKVLIESPLASPTIEGLVRNKKYARECMRDCLSKGEAPYASHLLYAQEGLLDDDIPAERALGIHAGLVWGKEATKTIVYTDLGISLGMERGIKRAKEEGREVIYRELGFVPDVHPLEIRIEVNKLLKENQKKIEIENDDKYTKEQLQDFLDNYFIKTSDVKDNFDGKHKFKHKLVYENAAHEVILWKNSEKFYLIAGPKGKLSKVFFNNNGHVELYESELIKEVFLAPILNQELKQNDKKVSLRKI